MIKKQAIVCSKVDRMRQEIEFTITINNQTHDLIIVFYYNEENDDPFNRELTDYRIDTQPIQDAILGEHEDFGENLSESLIEWISNSFGTDKDKLAYEKYYQEHQELFNQIWDFLCEENLV